MSLFEKLKSFVNREKSEGVYPEMPMDDWATRDKSLMALRRLRRRQIDEVEREQLSKDISSSNSERDKRGFYGSSLFKGEKTKVWKKQGLFNGSCGFLGKGRI